jgi:hypothetical protein
MSVVGAKAENICSQRNAALRLALFFRVADHSQPRAAAMLSNNFFVLR